MRPFIYAALIGAAISAALPALAATDTPVGLWKNIDDKTGKTKAEIRISEANGVLQGKIEKLFRAPEQDQNPKCTACKGDDKDKPLIGLSIINGMKKDGDEYKGTILDPEEGEIYKSTMKLTDGGNKLAVRGYIGVPMFGRSQTWVRQE